MVNYNVHIYVPTYVDVHIFELFDVTRMPSRKSVQIRHNNFVW